MFLFQNSLLHEVEIAKKQVDELQIEKVLTENKISLCSITNARCIFKF